MKVPKIKPPTYLLISIFIMLTLHFLFPVILIVPPIWNLLGIIPLAIGITINLMADKAFHRAETPVCPFEEFPPWSRLAYTESVETQCISGSF